MTKRHRSAVTGEYVTAEQAKADPERTVSESAKDPFAWVGGVLESIEAEKREKAELLARIEALEAAVAELQAKP